MEKALKRAQREADQQIKGLESNVADSKIPGVHHEIRNAGALMQEHLDMWKVIKIGLNMLETSITPPDLNDVPEVKL
jgi:hypothetical protein